MKMRTNQQGISHVLVIGLVAIIALVGLAAFRVYDANQTTPTASKQAPAEVISEPEKINNAADAQKVEASLDQADVDGGVNESELDADLNDLL